MMVLGSIIDRTLAVPVQMQPCSVSEKPTDCVEMSPGSCEVKRSRAISISSVWINISFYNLENKILIFLKQYYTKDTYH